MLKLENFDTHAPVKTQPGWKDTRPFLTSSPFTTEESDQDYAIGIRIKEST